MSPVAPASASIIHSVAMRRKPAISALALAASMLSVAPASAYVLTSAPLAMRKPAMPAISALALVASTLSAAAVSAYVVTPPPPVALPKSKIPPLSISTGLENMVYQWRGQEIRYLAAGPAEGKPVVLIHGLFVNADQWRRTIHELGDAGYRTYAVDLLGSGWSSKPSSDSLEAKLLNGENGRFLTTTLDDDLYIGHRGDRVRQPSIRENVILGTSGGGRRVAKEVDLRHPLNSCYNFYTWAEQISDFTKDVVFDGTEYSPDGTHKTATLVGNSKGTVVALQSVLDTPEYFDGVCCIDPTYREMHQAEMRHPAVTMPIVNLFQRFLRSRGKGLYNLATQHHYIKSILKEPYYNLDAIDDQLVECLTAPLNLPNSAEVVFDELAYTTGPLFEQLLQDLNDNPASPRKHIWVCYGEEDPWLSPERVESLITTPFSDGGVPVVNRVVAIPHAGHCPQDERPEATNAILLDFLRTCE